MAFLSQPAPRNGSRLDKAARQQRQQQQQMQQQILERQKVAEPLVPATS